MPEKVGPMSDASPHWRALEAMYLGAPINAFYQPRIEVSHETAVIEVDVGHHFFHPAGAVHGSSVNVSRNSSDMSRSSSLASGSFAIHASVIKSRV